MKKFAMILCATLFLFGISSCSVGGNGQENQVQEPEQSAEPTAIYTGDGLTIYYGDTYSVDGVSGCVYLSLNIENTGNSACTYVLSNVYIDDVSCDTGSGVPISADSGKTASGAFILFTDKAVEDMSEIEFTVEARNSETFDVLYTSDTMTISP